MFGQRKVVTEGQINDPSLGKILFSSLLPSNSLLSQSQTLERLFDLTKRTFKALYLASYFASRTIDEQEHCQVAHEALRSQGPTPSRTN